MRTHPGRVRHTNQDACGALVEHRVFVVCDGVGGSAAGELASHLATEAFLNSFRHSEGSPRPPRTSPNRASEPRPPNHPGTRLQEAVRAANHAVFQRAQKSRALRGMGTTLVAALLDPCIKTSTLWLAHVGDSRAYLFRKGTLQLLTRDHSLVEEQLSAGLISRDQAEASPLRNIITRAVGSQPAVEADIAAHPMQPGDIFLLASDGLTRELPDAAIAKILLHAFQRTAAPSHLDDACDALIDGANANGGRDNITVALVACG
jgi:protein phosphatase